MRRVFLVSMIVGFLSVTGLVLSPLPATSADEAKTIDIVKNADGKFVFSDPNAKIAIGQSITWVAKDGDVPHQLVPDTEADAFTDTPEFDATSPQTQRFDAPGAIKYHCAIHPKSMKGTITVTAAAENPAEEPAEAPAKPVKRKPKPSYGY